MTDTATKMRAVALYRDSDLSVADIADQLKVSPSSIYRWAEQGDLVPQKTRTKIIPITPNGIVSEDLWSKLDNYWELLHKSPLAERSIEDYYYFAECFVRWMDGSFVPGDKVVK